MRPSPMKAFSPSVNYDQGWAAEVSERCIRTCISVDGWAAQVGGDDGRVEDVSHDGLSSPRAQEGHPSLRLEITTCYTG